MKELVKQCFEFFNVHLSDYQIGQFENYARILTEWNKKINLTRIEDDTEIAIKHFADSISSVKAILYEKQSVIDIGSGAGFPGIPIKIAFPNISLSLIEPVGKKAKFLIELAKELKLILEVINENAENLGHEKEFRERFDICLCRALGPLYLIIEYGIPLIKVGGNLIAYKGNNYQQEVDKSSKSLKELNARISEKIEITLPLSDYKRNLIVVEKIWITDLKYPRKPGIPKKRPII